MDDEERERREVKNPFFALALGMLVFVCSSELEAQESKTEQPNIVLFVVDDLGPDLLDRSWKNPVATPHIDRLRADGADFLNAYSAAPIGPPSRACLLTGRSPLRHGIISQGHSAAGEPELQRKIAKPTLTDLGRKGRTIVDALKPSGYRTAVIGKWNIGAGPAIQGFDVNVAGNRAPHPYNGYFSPYGNRNLPDGKRGEYLTERLTKEALGFIGLTGDRPFFLYFAHFAVHEPLEAQKARLDAITAKAPKLAEDVRRRLAMLESVDASLGALREKLDALPRKSIIILTSDNGCDRRRKGSLLRGEKGSLYEGGIRVPLIICGKGYAQKGIKIADAVTSVDIATSILDWTKTTRRYTATEGQSLRSLALGKPDPSFSRTLVWDYPVYLGTKDNKGLRARPAIAARRGKYKLIRNLETESLELYDLDRDPGETKNIVASKKMVVAEFKSVLERASLTNNPEYVRPQKATEPSNKSRFMKK